MTYREFFHKATGLDPYPYQEKLAGEEWPEVLIVPTGAGKTAAVILSWLYRREFGSGAATRLIFCLPMRVLVGQIADNAQAWIKNLGLSERYSIHRLLGGFLEEEWEKKPERPCIIVGTQDHLLSRALNRGYAMSRFRWSIPFGLLNNDCQWVYDEVQLMGAARQTSAQLQAFRSPDVFGSYGPSKSLWMSATLRPDFLETVDFPAPKKCLELDKDTDKLNPSLARRLGAQKSIERAQVSYNKANKKDYAKLLANEVLERHLPGTLTLVVLNRVDRAVEVYQALQKATKTSSGSAELLLIHSRFRPGDRDTKQLRLTELERTPTTAGAIVVSTQVVEAGVDLSARLLVTELCPYSSAVQRFGRCNRDGLQIDGGKIVWINIEDDYLPYEEGELVFCREKLTQLVSASPTDLGPIDKDEPSGLLLRKTDIKQLFETTADLAGEDVDVSRFIRDPNLRDVQVFWRELESEITDEPLPARSELCSVSINGLRDFIGPDRLAYRWNFAEERWEPADKRRLVAGQVYLIPSKCGGYSEELGFRKDSKTFVIPISSETKTKNGFSDDPRSWTRYMLELETHTTDVLLEMRSLINSLDHLRLPIEDLENTCWWHDYGKSHYTFQQTMTSGLKAGDPRLHSETLWGKGISKGKGHSRPGFRHEFASALAALKHGVKPLVVFLIATHHGKIRFSVRPIPQEQMKDGLSSIRGVVSGDKLPPIKWEGWSIAETELDLSVVQIGAQPGWMDSLLALLDSEDYGIFRLGYLEAIVRTADVVASSKEDHRMTKEAAGYV